MVSTTTTDGKPHFLRELRLDVSNFYQDQDTRNLLQAEEALRTFGDGDLEQYWNDERSYKCIFGNSAFYFTKSSTLALSLFCTIAVAVIVITIVLLCTFMTLTNSAETSRAPDDVTNVDVVGVINWLHYPIGDLVLRRTNHSKIQ